LRLFEDQTRTIYRVPSTGGGERKLKDLSPLAKGPLSWSPDGKWLAFSERSAEAEPFRIVRLSVETLEKEPLTTPPPDSLGDQSPEFSPDGSQIVFSRSGAGVGMGGRQDLWVQPVSGGEERQLTRGLHSECSATWMPNGNELLASIAEIEDVNRIVRLDLKGNAPVPVPGLGENTMSPSVWGNSLVYVSLKNFPANIRRVPGRRAAPANGMAEDVIASSVTDGAPAFSRDGSKITFTSNRSGMYNIWRCEEDGSNATQLTNFTRDTVASSWSPDGRRIAF